MTVGRQPAFASSTAVPAGNCVTHGYHGRVACPRCSTSTHPPLALSQPSTDDGALEDAKVKLRWIVEKPVFELLTPTEALAVLEALDA